MHLGNTAGEEDGLAGSCQATNTLRPLGNLLAYPILFFVQNTQTALDCMDNPTWTRRWRLWNRFSWFLVGDNATKYSQQPFPLCI